MDLPMEFLNGQRGDAELRHLLPFNGDVDDEPLCLVMTSGLLAAGQALNHSDGSANSSSDVDGVGGGVPNCAEAEGEMDDVEDA